MAGLHFFTPDTDHILAFLKAEFSHSPTGDSEIQARAALFGSIIQRNLNTTDPDALSAARGAASQLVGEDIADGKALVVVRSGIVSLYRPSHIRADNLDNQTVAYSLKTGCPVLGAAMQGEENFTLVATDGEEETSGYYWFEMDDCQPADAGEVCELLGRPDWEAGLEKAFDCDDAESLLSAFTDTTGLAVTAGQCRNSGLALLESWPGADLYKG